MDSVDLAARAAADDMDITVDSMDEIAALEQQLAVERDALSEAEVAREKARKASVLKSEIEDARRRRKEEEALAQCEAKHGLLGKSLERIDTIDGMVVVKKPDGIKVRKWQDQYKEDISADALRQIARPCVVYPELSEFDALVAERPVVMVSVATAVLKLAGLRLKELGGKIAALTEQARGDDGVAAECMRALFQDRGDESEAGFVRGAAGAVVLLRELRRIAGEIEALRKAMKG